MKLQVFELDLKLFLLKNIEHENVYAKISYFIDSALAKDYQLLNLHNSNMFKYYVFNTFYPIEKEQLYKKDNIYAIQIRTVNVNLAKYFNSVLKNHYTEDMKGLTIDIRSIPRKYIDYFYSLTPILLKNSDFGYWRDNLSVIDFERRIKENLIKKYNNVMNLKIEENFELFTSLEITNQKPIAFTYKSKKILGDKVKINISNNDKAQELAYMALGTGIGEMNARGAGYVNYKWVKR